MFSGSTFKTSRWNGAVRRHPEPFPALLLCPHGLHCSCCQGRWRLIKAQVVLDSYGWVLWGLEFMHIARVLEVLMLGLTCLAYLLTLSVFDCRWSCSPLQHAKMRSSSWENRVHGMPLSLPAVALVVIYSITSVKSMEELMHPCLTLDSTGNHSVSVAN